MDFYVQHGEMRACAWLAIRHTGPQTYGGAGDLTGGFGGWYNRARDRFFEWIGLKEKLHRLEHKPPFVSERDLWWASLGQNVGSEVNGKSDRFSRPVLIMWKLAHGFYLVAPTTTREREGTLTRK